MRTAVVHDWLNGMRGGEKVLEALLPLVPEPTIFTLFHVPGSVSPGIERFPIRPSFLNRLPFAACHYRQYLPLFASAVESFDLSGFGLVVSSSHCVAKGAIAPAGSPHLCYCHTPVRYAYDQFDTYFPRGRTRLRGLKRIAVARLRDWDQRTADRPSRYLANSSAVARRIRRHYGREARVCHPPVDVEFFTPAPGPRGEYLLSVGALVPYKRYEDAIEAARMLGRRLVLVGKGPEEAALRARAAGTVDIRTNLTPDQLRQLYRECAMFLQPGEEDFGISSVEALACGAPVVALARGGVLDVVVHGETGILYDEEAPEALADAIRAACRTRFDYTRMPESAQRFAPARFLGEFRTEIEELLRAS